MVDFIKLRRISMELANALINESIKKQLEEQKKSESQRTQYKQHAPHGHACLAFRVLHQGLLHDTG